MRKKALHEKPIWNVLKVLACRPIWRGRGREGGNLAWSRKNVPEVRSGGPLWKEKKMRFPSGREKNGKDRLQKRGKRTTFRGKRGGLEGGGSR